MTSPGCRRRSRFVRTMEEESLPTKNDFSLFRFLPPLDMIVVVVVVIVVVVSATDNDFSEGVGAS